MSKKNKKETEQQKKQENKDNEIIHAAQKALDDKKAEYDALWDKYLRLCADFDNARKRWEKERQGLVEYANYSLVKELIIVVDELEHALVAVKEHAKDNPIVKGIEIIHLNLIKILKKEGVEVIQAKGEKFNPHVHEIIAQRQSDETPEHTVLEEVQKGYKYKDKLLRTAKVVIAAESSSEQETQEATDKPEPDKEQE
jgi:molecular chaperone GrpE